jgi:nicotinamide mononucleotide transporter PnuC
MDIIHKNRAKIGKYALWIALLCTEIIVGALTQSHIFVTAIAIIGVISAICSAEGLYATHFVFLAYAAGSITIAWHHQLYGEVLAMSISSIGSLIALITWRKNLNRRTVRTRTLNWEQWMLTFVGCLILNVLAYVFITYQGELAILNALVVGLTITAEILFMLRYCDSYILYFVDDIVLIAIWALTGNWILVCSCAISTLCTIYGMSNWRKLRQKKGN